MVDIYAEERGNDPCCGLDSDPIYLTWIGKVGLIYPTDQYMVYANGVNTACYDNPVGCSFMDAPAGWLYNSNVVEGESHNSYFWVITGTDGNSIGFNINEFGGFDNEAVYWTYGVRPVVYLKSSVKITDGDGTSGNPYKLSL